MSQPPFVPNAAPAARGLASGATWWAGIAVTALLVIWSAAEVLLAGAHLLRLRAADGLASGTPDAHSRFTSADSLVTLAGVAQAAVLAATATAFCVWLFKARSDAERLSGHPHRWGRPWLVLGWVIPFGNFWIPRQVLDDIWQASAGRAERRRPVLLMVWWAFFLIFEIGDRVLARVGDGGGLDAVRLASNGAMMLAVPGLAAAVLAVLVVWKINSLQEATARHLAAVMAVPAPGMPAPGAQASVPPLGTGAPTHPEGDDEGWSPVR